MSSRISGFVGAFLWPRLKSKTAVVQNEHLVYLGTAGPKYHRSQHRLREFGAAGRCWCEDCLQHAPKGVVQGKAWLLQCRPDQQLVSVLANAAGKPQAVQNTMLPASSAALPGLHTGPQMLGWKTAHHMHEINVYRGLFFCLKCGSYGSDKPKKLTAACSPPPHR